MRIINCKKNKNGIDINKVCVNKYNELKNVKNNMDIWAYEPQKRYEIYKVCGERKEQLCIVDTKDLPDSKKKELYYDKDIALKIYDNMLNLEDNMTNSFPELMELYQNEISEIQKNIEELKIKDNKKYQEDLSNYRLIQNTELFKRMKKNVETMQEENTKLKEKIKEDKHIIDNLSNMLRISLNRFEELQNRKTGILEKVYRIFKI